MSLRSRLVALLFGASVPVRDRRLPQVTSEIFGPVVTPARKAELIEDGRTAFVEFMARSPRVEREHHFNAPRFG